MAWWHKNINWLSQQEENKNKLRYQSLFQINLDLQSLIALHFPTN